MKAWRDWAILTGGLSVVFFGWGNYWSATWLSKWALLLALYSGAISFWAARRTSLLYLPLMLYVSGSLIAVAVWPQQPYKELFDPVMTLALQKNGLYALVVWLLVTISFASILRNDTRSVCRLLSMIWAIGTLGILVLPLSGSNSAPNNGLWFGNPSMAASLLACLLPFVWGIAKMRRGRPKTLRVITVTSWLLTLAAIYKTRASVPWGVLGAVSSAAIVTRISPTIRSWLWAAASSILIGATLLILGSRGLGSQFFDQNGRFEIWQMAYQFFCEHANRFLGFGFSTSQTMLPIEQVSTGHYHGDYFLWLHNDWLQLALEGGVVGMVCIYLAFFRLLAVSWRRMQSFPSLVGFAVLGLFNYPLRMPIHCMCLILICGLTEAWAPRATRSA